jgi:hypothetical protein
MWAYTTPCKADEFDEGLEVGASDKALDLKRPEGESVKRGRLTDSMPTS